MAGVSGSFASSVGSGMESLFCLKGMTCVLNAVTVVAGTVTVAGIAMTVLTNVVVLLGDVRGHESYGQVGFLIRFAASDCERSGCRNRLFAAVSIVVVSTMIASDEGRAHQEAGAETNCIGSNVLQSYKVVILHTDFAQRPGNLALSNMAPLIMPAPVG